MKSFISYFKLHKFLLINLFIFLYILINLLDGNRGYFSYIKKMTFLLKKIEEEKYIINQLESLKLKNAMLIKPNLNLDFLDELYRNFLLLVKKMKSYF
ncbi:MAG: hypothetical protein FF85_03250, partial [alpha proteobacterium QL1]